MFDVLEPNELEDRLFKLVFCFSSPPQVVRTHREIFLETACLERVRGNVIKSSLSLDWASDEIGFLAVVLVVKPVDVEGWFEIIA